MRARVSAADSHHSGGPLLSMYSATGERDLGTFWGASSAHMGRNQPAKDKQRQTKRASGGGVCVREQNAADRQSRAGSTMPPPKKRPKSRERQTESHRHLQKGRKSMHKRQNQKKSLHVWHPDSHAAPHRSTDRLTGPAVAAQSGRGTVRFTEYGRGRVQQQTRPHMQCRPPHFGTIRPLSDQNVLRVHHFR